MVTKKQLLQGLVLSSLIGATLAFLASLAFLKNQNHHNTLIDALQGDTNIIVPKGLNFIYAAERVKPAVVSINTRFEHAEDPILSYDKDNISSGSGVIISPDGYIVTNNHVIEFADQIEIVLNDKSIYKAKVIGNHPNTDLALLKIDEKDLPFVRFGNTENLRVGEWVLAIGNPFNLSATVTAGIVCAKSRSLSFTTNDHLKVESFIQTDAVVNPGNSGGALVNLKGELVGINTAIATETGSFSGYAFAVPVELIDKVTQDLKKYKQVQSAVLGIISRDISSAFQKEKGLENTIGVYVENINPRSAAEEAGIRKGDIVLAIEDQKVISKTQLQFLLALKKPGDTLNVAIKRAQSHLQIQVRMKNIKGEYGIIDNGEDQVLTLFGASFINVSPLEMNQLGIDGGVKILRLKSGKIKSSGIKSGFIITHASQNGKRKSIKGKDDILHLLNRSDLNIYLEGIYPDGSKGYYPIN